MLYNFDDHEQSIISNIYCIYNFNNFNLKKEKLNETLFVKNII